MKGGGPKARLGSSLLAVILVTKSSRGASFVYSFPPNPTAVPRTLKPIYPSRNLPASLASSDSSGDSSGTGSDTDDGSVLLEGDATLETYLELPRHVLASILCPTRELCDQPFELVIEEYAFVGHPVWLGEEHDDQDESAAGTRGRSREPAQARQAPPSSERASSLDAAETNDSGVSSSQQSQSSTKSDNRLLSFNLVIAVDTPPDSHLSSHLESYYKDVIIPLTANLKALEKQENWLGSQASLIRRTQEKLAEDGLGLAETLGRLPSIAPLANAISQLYIQLREKQSATISLAHNSRVQVLLRGELPTLVGGAAARAATNETSSDEDDDTSSLDSDVARERELLAQRSAPLFSRMRRREPAKYGKWQTLVPLEDPSDLLTETLPGTLLARVLEDMNAENSILDYEEAYELEDDSAMRDVINHLVHWRKARVEDVVDRRNLYVLRSSFRPASLFELAGRFANDFPEAPSLGVVLSKVSCARPIHRLLDPIMPEHLVMPVLVWLIRHEIIEHYRTYLRLVATPRIKREARHKWSGVKLSSKANESSFSEGASAEPGSASSLTRVQSATSIATASSGSAGAAATRRARHNSSSQSLTKTRSRTSLQDVDEMAIVGSALQSSPKSLGRSAGMSVPSSTSQSSVEAMAARAARRRRAVGKTQTMSSIASSNDSGSLPAQTPDGARPGEQDNDDGKASIILEPGRPSELESRWITAMSLDVDPAVVENFDKMRPMMNGLHQLDEILFRTDLDRRAVRKVLAAFKDFVVEIHHS